MKQSNEHDAACIDKTLKYIQTINNAYATFNINNADDLEGNDICRLAVTQAITNIYELKQKIQAETLAKAPLFSKLRLGLKAARNIASHDYDSLDFDIIYKITRQLISQEVLNELEVIRDAVKPSDTGDLQS